MYIGSGVVFSLSHMFYVSNGLGDIRMVYNATLCGLSAVLCDPHFGLHVVQQTLWSLLPDYFQCDMNMGEMFLNFPLHPNIRPCAGVGITHVRGKEGQKAAWVGDRREKWERWSRNFMGLTNSPYKSLQLFIRRSSLIMVTDSTGLTISSERW